VGSARSGQAALLISNARSVRLTRPTDSAPSIRAPASAKLRDARTRSTMRSHAN